MATVTEKPKLDKDVVFDSIQYPWLKVAMRDEGSKTDEGFYRTRIKRIQFTNGFLITSDPEVIGILRQRDDVFEADGTGPHDCPECKGQLHSVKALKRHMQKHIAD